MRDWRLDQLRLEVRPDISIKDLLRAEELFCINEGQYFDSDGEPFFVYTVAGTLDGKPIETVDHRKRCVYGALVGGDAMIVHAKSKAEADWLATSALQETIEAARVMAATGGLDDERNAGIIISSEMTGKSS